SRTRWHGHCTPRSTYCHPNKQEPMTNRDDGIVSADALDRVTGGFDWDAANQRGHDWSQTTGGFSIEGGLAAGFLYGIRHGNVPEACSYAILGGAWGLAGIPVGYAAGFTADAARQAWQGGKKLLRGK